MTLKSDTFNNTTLYVSQTIYNNLSLNTFAKCKIFTVVQKLFHLKNKITLVMLLIIFNCYSTGVA